MSPSISPRNHFPTVNLSLLTTRAKMLAAPSSSPHHYNSFRPVHSSPLARDARRATFGFAMNDSSNNTPTHAAASSSNAFTFGQQPSNTSNQQRQIPKAAQKISAELLGTQRRGAFLRKVREGREDRRWETRGEDVCSCRTIYL